MVKKQNTVKRLWSISTTVRNPERLVDFLRVLKQLEGQKFDNNNQMNYQILLIKERLYTPTNIPSKYKQLFEDASKEISYEVAKEVFEAQNYQDPPMRGRQSVNPLNKLGFCVARESAGVIRITSLGNLFLSPNPNIGRIFLKSLLKLQFPNPMSDDFSEKKGFNISPFIASLHLIKKAGGLSQTEFALFVPTLINFKDIDRYSSKVAEFRKPKPKKENEAFVIDFLKTFYGVNDLSAKQLSNPFEYGDNTMRYFRLTKYLRVIKQPFGHWKIDFEPSRLKEIEQLLALYDGAAQKFNTADDYINYLSDIDRPELPWELNDTKAKDVAVSLLSLVKNEFKNLDVSIQSNLKTEYENMIATDLKKSNLKALEEFIDNLREFRFKLNQLSKDNLLRKNITKLNELINVFSDRKHIRALDPVEFEYMIAQCLKIIDDEISIKPNCIFDDGGNPIGFAPGNRADIEGYYTSFNSIFEATLDISRNQVYRESMPVMRHLKEFENKYSDKPAFCIFIAPRIHDDTVNYFWISVKHGFEGKKQKIIAFELAQFVQVLECFIVTVNKKKQFTHKTLMDLLESIVADADSKDSSVNWFNDVSSNIERWESSVV